MTANKRFYFSDDEIEDLAVDEDELVELGLDIRPIRKPREDKPKRARQESKPGRIEALLVEAGYDPKHIPKSLRKTALDVAECWEMGLCDDDDVALAISRSTHAVRNAARVLNVAGIPKSSLETPNPTPRKNRYA